MIAAGMNGEPERTAAVPAASPAPAQAHGRGSSSEVAQGRRGRGRGRRERWLGPVAVLVFVGIKAEAYRNIIEHRTGLIVLFGAWLLGAILRRRPIALAVAVGALVALGLDVHPVVAGVGLAVGLIALLVALSFVVSTILHARQPAD